jgi:hypothetical protein
VAQSHMRKEAVDDEVYPICGFGCSRGHDRGAVCEGRREGRSLGTIPNRPEPIRKLVKRLEPISTLRVCYEAGPTGYALYWPRWTPKTARDGHRKTGQLK